MPMHLIEAPREVFRELLSELEERAGHKPGMQGQRAKARQSRILNPHRECQQPDKSEIRQRSGLTPYQRMSDADRQQKRYFDAKRNGRHGPYFEPGADFEQNSADQRADHIDCYRPTSPQRLDPVLIPQLDAERHAVTAHIGCVNLKQSEETGRIYETGYPG